MSELTSVTGKLWKLRPYDDRQALALAQRLKVPEIVGRILAIRGVPLEMADSFLNPRLREHLPDPFHLRDMDKAASRIAAAVANASRYLAIMTLMARPQARCSSAISRRLASLLMCISPTGCRKGTA